MRRAYRPSNSTYDLARRIENLPGIDRVDIVAPNSGVTVTPARLKVTLEADNNGIPAATIFSLSEARKWLEEEEHFWKTVTL